MTRPGLTATCRRSAVAAAAIAALSACASTPGPPSTTRAVSGTPSGSASPTPTPLTPITKGSITLQPAPGWVEDTAAEGVQPGGATNLIALTKGALIFEIVTLKPYGTPDDAVRADVTSNPATQTSDAGATVCGSTIAADEVVSATSDLIGFYFVRGLTYYKIVFGGDKAAQAAAAADDAAMLYTLGCF